MSTCNLDHTLEDVTKKLSEQKPFLPVDLFEESNHLLEQRPDQNTLNELFHLLKKYDLASEEERAGRNTGISKLTSK
ncbi:group-specific protein [Sporosarcina sp. Marseille-Q4063]|uniref:group-specific protein n=1 Tax=Sporosarcina sp. Marseille-Q4063 TaxID=2810514 RepID=UPI001BAF173C|nr:group-specific protein [Sporosarcina sp. Marseille-Q4063]QUW21966.1 group-specific protein [Sporosarcina sp. Marseille-Q4063]